MYLYHYMGFLTTAWWSVRMKVFPCFLPWPRKGFIVLIRSFIWAVYLTGLSYWWSLKLVELIIILYGICTCSTTYTPFHLALTILKNICHPSSFKKEREKECYSTNLIKVAMLTKCNIFFSYSFWYDRLTRG